MPHCKSQATDTTSIPFFGLNPSIRYSNRFKVLGELHRIFTDQFQEIQKQTPKKNKAIFEEQGVTDWHVIGTFTSGVPLKTSQRRSHRHSRCLLIVHQTRTRSSIAFS
ncbi:hypothetical protein M378DRAFT_291479 [Amanita muscaria Koide BX008]|uniref:Uncharacterized protein n=1 Tax=Amanita muscaria (strain Koide BX008) TaxID=946122 RepID=A0A0C2WC05_AMAMK|nr:hypothetical protein M378DRAFT_291479 [Amanita muscaria Koide BX008]